MITAGWDGLTGAAGVALNPLATLLHRELLTRSVLHADETTLRILDTRKGGKTRSGYLWAYTSGEKSGPAIVCFDSQTGHGHEHPAAWLKGWSGALVADGYITYETLVKHDQGIMLVGCWAHARRGFAELYKANKDPPVETTLLPAHCRQIVVVAGAAERGVPGKLRAG